MACVASYVTVVLDGVGLIASALGEAATDRVGRGDDGDVEPCLVGAEPLRTVAAGGGDDCGDREPKFRGLERCLGLGGETV